MTPGSSSVVYQFVFGILDYRVVNADTLHVGLEILSVFSGVFSALFHSYLDVTCLNEIVVFCL